MNCCKIKDKTHATQMFKTLTNTLHGDVLYEVFTQMFKTLTNTLHGDVLYEVFTILFCFILL
jgi:hypothetical protein